MSPGRVTTYTWSAPAAVHSLITCPRAGVPASGSISFGTTAVNGRNRVPCPAAVTTAGNRGAAGVIAVPRS